jgi:TonB-dependent starch-binding outer membrane protein SusC
MRRNLPDITGFNSIMANLGELENRGFELTMNSVNISSSNLTWRSNFVFSLNRNKINRLFGDVGTYTLLGEEREGELPDFSNLWFPGQAIDVVWDYEILGVYQEHEADEAAQYNLRMGDYKVVDVNEDGKLVDVVDKQFIGHTAPRYRMGMRNDFSFLKNFTASIFIRADLGHISTWSTPTQPDMFYGTRSIGRPYKYWTKDDPDTEHSRLDFRFARGFYDGNINVHRSRAFVRIQDLTISYNLPGFLANSLLMNSTNIFFSVRNLYSFDKWPDFDPESGMSPMPRTFTLGINMSL